MSATSKNEKAAKIVFSKEENRRQVFKLLPIAGGQLLEGKFANEVLGLRANRWSAIVNGERLPDEHAKTLEKYFRDRFRSFEFKRQDLDLSPRDFVALFIREEVHRDLLRAVKSEAPAPQTSPPPHPLKRFFGLFCGLYVCSDLDDTSKSAVAVDTFEISEIEDAFDTARITQPTYLFGTQPASGSLRLKHDTVEFHINFGNRDDPDAIYMASDPRSHVITSLLAVSIDLRYPYRRVTAYPILFIKIPEGVAPKASKVFSEQTTLFAATKSIFENYVLINSKRFWIECKAALDEAAEDNIRKIIIETLREEAAEPRPPEGLPSRD